MISWILVKNTKVFLRIKIAIFLFKIVSEECELCLTSSSSSPPPPPLEAPAGFSPANNGGHGMRLQPFMKQPPLAFLGTSRTLPVCYNIKA